MRQRLEASIIGFAFACLLMAAMNVDAADAASAPPVVEQLTGPTLHFTYANDFSSENILTDFMYFIPLISPEPVTVTSTSLTNQFVRMLSFSRKDHAGAFHAVCEFEFIGDGSEHNAIDQSAHIRRRDEQLKSGHPMQRLLASIDVRGSGKGIIETDGVLTNGLAVANSVKFGFNVHGQQSPVSIMLEDIHYANGVTFPANEIVARVNTLTFQRKPGTPTMDVAIASVKPKGARDTFWQNFKAGFKGSLANLFIPPLTVTQDGHDTLLDFGSALANQSPTFTFPLATNIVKSSISQ